MSIQIPNSGLGLFSFRKVVSRWGSGSTYTGYMQYSSPIASSANMATNTAFCAHFTFPERCIVREFFFTMEAQATTPAQPDPRVRFAVYNANASGLPTTMIPNSLNTINLVNQGWGVYTVELPTSGQFRIEEPRRVIVVLSTVSTGWGADGGAGRMFATTHAQAGFPTETDRDYTIPVSGFGFESFPATMPALTVGSATRVNTTTGTAMRLCNWEFGFGVEVF